LIEQILVIVSAFSIVSAPLLFVAYAFFLNVTDKTRS